MSIFIRMLYFENTQLQSGESLYNNNLLNNML